MVTNTEADQNESPALVLCLFIVPDTTISRKAKEERKAVWRVGALVSILHFVLWKSTLVVTGLSELF